MKAFERPELKISVIRFADILTTSSKSPFGPKGTTPTSTTVPTTAVPTTTAIPGTSVIPTESTFPPDPTLPGGDITLPPDNFD